MPILKLERCPKCKGHLILEKDNYGVYQQCLQCGYLHDIKTFSVIGEQEIEKDEEVAASTGAIEGGSNNRPQKAAKLPLYSSTKALTVPQDLASILSSLQERHLNSRQ